MRQSNNGKVVNGFYLKEKRRNGSMEGIQSLKNKESYVFIYDEAVKDFVGKWIDTPEFARGSKSKCV